MKAFKRQTISLRQRKSLILALSAAIAIVTLTFPARAAITYTPMNVAVSGNGVLRMDLNHDGTSDISIVVSGRSVMCAGTGPGSAGSVYGLPASGSGIVANGSYILALANGTRISSSNFFYSAQGLMVQYSSCLWPPHLNLGAWLGVTNHYLGLKFQIGGHVHYGWARLNVTFGKFGPVATLTGCAYETISGQGINAGQTNGP